MINIRTMNHQDISRVCKLLRSCYRWLGKIEGFTPEIVEFLVRKRGSVETITSESMIETYLVACKNTKIVGVVSIKENEITKLYVSPLYHGHGIGRLLYQAAEDIIAKNGYPNIVLGAIGKSPVPLYQSMGMEISGRKIGKMEHSPGIEVMLMEKAISR